MTAAATEVRGRFEDTLRARLGKRRWREFAGRLDIHLEPLFRALHHLYGWRYDFAWILEELLMVAATGCQERPDRLRKSDRKPAKWPGDRRTLWVSAFIDQDPAAGSPHPERLAELRRLGATHLHLHTTDPAGAAPPGDPAWKEVMKEARAERLGLVVDLACHHTSSEHPWARAAAGGDEAMAGFFFFYPDRTIPDLYAPHLRSIYPERSGDAFTWHPEVGGGSWIWTTFQPDQWDLNYQNPRVLVAVAAEMLRLANLGVEAIRLAGTPFLWKQPGTSCENLPPAHLIVEVLRLVIELAAPSVVLVSEAVVPMPDLPRFVNARQCRLGYHHALMAALWSGIATGDARLAARVLAATPPLDEGCGLLAFARDQDAIGWGFPDDFASGLGVDPASHRHFLTEFFSGREGYARGAVFQGDRVSGRLASLLGLEASVGDIDRAAIARAEQRILALLTVVATVGGIPVVVFGDHRAAFNDYRHGSDPSADSRWLHRARLGDPIDDGEPGQTVAAALQQLISLRRRMAGWEPQVGAVPFDAGDPAVLAYQRGPAAVLVNLSERPALVDRGTLGATSPVDLLSGDVWEEPVLGPFQCRVITFR
jgi:amylosucrase